MDKLISSFTAQLTEAIRIGRSAELTPQHHDLRNIVVSGPRGGRGQSSAGCFGQGDLLDARRNCRNHQEHRPWHELEPRDATRSASGKEHH